jgi:hypothetical protein
MTLSGSAGGKRAFVGECGNCEESYQCQNVRRRYRVASHIASPVRRLNPQRLHMCRAGHVLLQFYEALCPLIQHPLLLRPQGLGDLFRRHV